MARRSRGRFFWRVRARVTGTGEDVGGGGRGVFEQEARARARGILANFANWMLIKVNLLRERSRARNGGNLFGGDFLDNKE